MKSSWPNSLLKKSMTKHKYTDFWGNGSDQEILQHPLVCEQVFYI